MDNADSITIMTLRQAGCSIDEDIQSLEQFTAEMLMECIATLLNSIDSSLELPINPPKENTRRFKHTSRLIQAMKVCFLSNHTLSLLLRSSASEDPAIFICSIILVRSILVASLPF